MLRVFGALLLPLCGWLTGDAFQQRTRERLCAQECERLDYYIARFQEFLQQAQQQAHARAGLPHRLGLAAGMVLAIFFF